MKTLLRLLIYNITLLVIIIPMTIKVTADGCVPAAGDPIRLGAIFPKEAFFTEENSEYFKGIDTMRLAINACGGVNGRPVEWIYQPATDRADSETAARKLITEDNVPLIVGSGLLAINEGARLAAEELGAVYWEVTEGVEPGGDWSFSIRPDNHQLGEAAGQFVRDVLPSALSNSELKSALIYENRPRGQYIAEGVLDTLPQEPVITYHYSDYLEDAYRLGVQLRENKVDVVILATFQDDADYLWYAARQADANVSAWIYIGNPSYRRGMCRRLKAINGFVSVDASGPVNAKFREDHITGVYQEYRSQYLAENSQQSTELADLAASGVYMLMRYVLPDVKGDYTAEDIRNAIRSLDDKQQLGMMGEGIVFKDSDGSNLASSTLIQQAQSGQFCTVWPSDLATCLGGIQPFPTWRERAIAAESQTCDPQT